MGCGAVNAHWDSQHPALSMEVGEWFLKEKKSEMRLKGEPALARRREKGGETETQKGGGVGMCKAPEAQGVKDRSQCGQACLSGPPAQRPLRALVAHSGVFRAS